MCQAGSSRHAAMRWRKTSTPAMSRANASCEMSTDSSILAIPAAAVHLTARRPISESYRPRAAISIARKSPVD